MSIPFCTCDPLVCRDCDCSRTALLVSTNLPCRRSSGSVFTRCEVQKCPPKLLTGLCLPRPWSSALLGQDFKSRQQDRFQADQLGQRALLVMLSPLSVSLLPLNLGRFCTGVRAALAPRGLQSLDTGGCIPFPFLLQSSQLWKKALYHSSGFKCARGLWISWGLHLLKWIYVMYCTSRQIKWIYETI